MTRPCAWCGDPFEPNRPGHGRPRLYCGADCRRRRGRYVESAPGWLARLTYLENCAAMYPTVPTFIANEIAVLRAALDSVPATAEMRRE